jgi:hypothetical protein
MRRKSRKHTRKHTRKNGGGSSGSSSSSGSHSSSGSRKMSGGKKGGNKWNKFVMGVYNEMKRKNPDVAFGDALKEASRLKKKGEY